MRTRVRMFSSYLLKIRSLIFIKTLERKEERATVTLKSTSWDLLSELPKQRICFGTNKINMEIKLFSLLLNGVEIPAMTEKELVYTPYTFTWGKLSGN